MRVTTTIEIPSPSPNAMGNQVHPARMESEARMIDEGGIPSIASQEPR